MKDFEANFSGKTKQCRGANNDEIEKTLLDWFRKARSKNILITGPMLQEKNAPCNTEDLDGKFSKIKIIFPAKEHNLSSATT